MEEIQDAGARAARGNAKVVLANKKKKSKYVKYETAPDNAIYIFF